MLTMQDLRSAFNENELRKSYGVAKHFRSNSGRLPVWHVYNGSTQFATKLYFWTF